jgi:hypothetical protein
MASVDLVVEEVKEADAIATFGEYSSLLACVHAIV